MRVLAYTFRTFPETEKLKEIFGNVFVFGKLKEDLVKFKQLAESEMPELIIGIAKSSDKTMLEAVCINKFNNGVITKNGPSCFNLNLPHSLKVPVNLNPGKTFCNWSAYKISEQGIAPTAFIHINPCDLNKLIVLTEK